MEVEFYTHFYIPQAIYNVTIILCGMYVGMGIEFQIAIIIFSHFE